jgi:hypothetical protein
MKPTVRFHLSTWTAATILATALTVTAAAQHLVPLKGSLQGDDSDQFVSDNILIVTTTGTGTSTLLGKFSFTIENTLTIDQGTTQGNIELVAANGDTIFGTVEGSGSFTGAPGMISITEIVTITGGTGRFEGAQGTITIQRLASAITFTTEGSFDGSITSPGHH